MKTPLKIVIVLLVAAAVVAAVSLKKNNAPASSDSAAPLQPAITASQIEAAASASTRLPKLIDLGADKCIPCKAMAPILEGLKTEYAGKMDVEFIDVWKNPEAGKAFGVEMIPTQIFYDEHGKELFRHTGFFGKEDILGKWKDLGVDVSLRTR